MAPSACAGNMSQLAGRRKDRQRGALCAHGIDSFWCVMKNKLIICVSQLSLWQLVPSSFHSERALSVCVTKGGRRRKLGIASVLAEEGRRKKNNRHGGSGSALRTAFA